MSSPTYPPVVVDWKAIFRESLAKEKELQEKLKTASGTEKEEIARAVLSARRRRAELRKLVNSSGHVDTKRMQRIRNGEFDLPWDAKTEEEEIKVILAEFCQS